jgi:hypothetical protein
VGVAKKHFGLNRFCTGKKFWTLKFLGLRKFFRGAGPKKFDPKSFWAKIKIL